MLARKINKEEIKPLNPDLKFVKDINSHFSNFHITNSQDVKPILDFLEIEDDTYDTIFILENKEVYGCEGIPYLEKRIWYLGNMDDIV